MARRARGVARYVLTGMAVVLVGFGGAAFLFRENIRRAALDPKQPFQTYRPPPAPDYTRPAAWALSPANPLHVAAGDPPADVFFVHSTTYDGGRDWNAPIDDPGALRFLVRTDLPNYAGPFQRVGRVFAPRYREASVYTALTLRDDAREARQFAYHDVQAAFFAFLKRIPAERPIVIAGVGQGANLTANLLQQVVDRDPALVRRLAAAYLIDSVTPADMFGPSAPVPACGARGQAHCAVGWAAVATDRDPQAARRLERALVWSRDGQLESLGGRAALCVNPLTGTLGGTAPARANLGAANATGMEWGVRPAFLTHQVSAACQGGLLRYSRPASPSLQRSGSWADRRKVPPFNLFYADIEADAQARVEALGRRQLYGTPAPPIQTTVEVRDHPVHRIG